jgi:hypothetical protein
MFTYGNNTISPGTYIKFKKMPGLFRFRAIVREDGQDKILCVSQKGEFYAFDATRFDGPVIKKSRRYK